MHKNSDSLMKKINKQQQKNNFHRMPCMSSFKHHLPQTATLLTQRTADFHNDLQLQLIYNISVTGHYGIKGKG